MGKASNKKLSEAKKNKNDEFYTLMPTTEAEIPYYKECLKGKTVYCNCDNPYKSNFYKHFKNKFKEYGLKRLIATCCAQTPHKAEFDGKNEAITKLSGNGDFRSYECKKVLNESDVVITNPPFSLFREFLSLLVQYDKKFLILGNLNAISYKNVFPLIMQNKIHLGVSLRKGGVEFIIPDDYEIKTKFFRVDEFGNTLVKMCGIRWFTNLEHNIWQDRIVLTKTYNPKDYPKYDNYDAINVDRVKDIPMDYDGIMGVPITYLDKHNPEQFEILGMTQGGCHDLIPDLKKYTGYCCFDKNGVFISYCGGKINEHPVLKGKVQKANYYQNLETGEVVHSLYQRIFIRKIN